MGEQITSMLVAIAGKPSGNNVEYSLDQLQDFAKGDIRLYIETDSLYVLNKGFVDVIGDLEKEPGQTVYPFTGMSNCLKCNEQNPYRKGMTTWNRPLDLLTRKCATCGFEWLEYCGDHQNPEEGNGTDQASETSESTSVLAG